MNQRHYSGRPRRARGYTLIETVVVVVIVGILAAGASAFIVRSVEGYTDVSRRAALVEAAESALRRMARDLHRALPNSVRITDPGTGASFALELLPTLDGAKYNVKANPRCSQLNVDKDATEFSVLACFRNSALTQYVGGAATDAFRLVINNRNTSIYTATGSPSPITPLGTLFTLSAYDASVTNCVPPATGACGTGGNRHHITWVTKHKFSTSKVGSPNHRLYAITTPVSYLCDTALGTLTRYYNYPIQGTQITTAAGFAPIASSALVTNRINNCRALTTTTDIRNRGLVTLSLGLSEAGETINLVHQVQLDNSR